MGAFDSPFSFSDPNQMALLGAIQGLTSASTPSRLPVTNGMVFGGLAGGLMSGAQQGYKNQETQQEALTGGLKNYNDLNSQGMLAQALGWPMPSPEELRQGKFKALSAAMPSPGGGAATAPQAPASAGSASPVQSGGSTGGAAPNFPAMAADAAQKSGIDGAFYNQLIKTESNFNPMARNPTAVNGEHASGIAQFMPSTAAQRGVNPLDPTSSLYGGAAYFADLLKQNNGDYVKAAQDYGTLPKDLNGKLDAGQQAVLEAAQNVNKAAAPAMTAPVTQEAQNAPAAPNAPASAIPPAAGNPATLRQYYTEMMVRNALHLPMTPVDQAIMAANMAPAGSQQQQLNLSAAMKAGGINQFIGGERRGSPIWRYNPQTNTFGLIAQNPQLPEGAIENPDGSIAMAPGAAKAIAGVSGAQAGGAVPAHVFESQNKPEKVGPEESVVIPGQMQPGGTPPLTAPAPAPAPAQMPPQAPAAAGPPMQALLPGGGGAAPAPAPAPAPGPTAAPVGAPAAPPQGALSTSTAPQALPPGVLRQGLNPGQEQALETRAKEEQTDRQETIEGGAAAQQQQAILSRLKDDSTQFTQGPFAPHIQQANTYLRALFGANTPQVASYEDFVKNAGSLTRAAVRETSSRAAVQEFKLIDATLPSPSMSPQGLSQIINEYQGLNDYKIAKTQAQQQWEQQHGGAGNVENFETTWQAQASPYAFVIGRMAPQDLQAMKARLDQTKAGQEQLQKIIGQLHYIKSAGLDANLQ